MSVYLDRRIWLGYTGDLSALPECALHEWRVCMGLASTAKHKDVLANNMHVASQPVPTDPSQLTASHLGLVAHFLNPAQSWRKKCLLEAWQFIRPFLVAPPQLKGKALPGTPIRVGWPTNEAPRTIPAALAYALCLSRGLRCTGLDRPEQLAELLHLQHLHEDTPGGLTVPALKKYLELIMTRADVPFWMELLSRHVPSAAEEQDENFYDSHLESNLKQVFDRSLQAHLYTIEAFTPTTPHEAILTAAMHLGINLSMSRCPVADYRSLVRDHLPLARTPRLDVWGKLTTFTSLDPSLADWCRQWPAALCLANDFPCPLVFPLAIFPADVMEVWAEREGLSTETSLSFMSPGAYLVSVVAARPRVFAGLPPPAWHTDDGVSLVERKPIDKLRGEESMWWTSVKRKDTAIVMTWRELMQFWSQAGKPIHPETAAVVEPHLMHKVRSLAVVTGHPEVNQFLDEFQHENQAINQQRRQIASTYKQCTPTVQAAWRTTLWTYLCLGMAMRDWPVEPPETGEGVLAIVSNPDRPWPLKERVVEDQSRVETTTERWYGAFYARLAELPADTKAFLLDLPVYAYRQGAFQATTDPQRGRTIKEKLQVISSNASGENVWACIRISSNWVVATAFLYLHMIGERLPFDIRQLDYIS